MLYSCNICKLLIAIWEIRSYEVFRNQNNETTQHANLEKLEKAVLKLCFNCGDAFSYRSFYQALMAYRYLVGVVGHSDYTAARRSYFER